ncbi:MAG TPA: sigma-70 family RNA polymerase sigma factor [Candidatus Nanopelagicaceae bacterium]|nr:sigma-70 family RNA polymerase sigma factor [Candidatus Nanopelagicaceae bacterium]
MTVGSVNVALIGADADGGDRARGFREFVEPEIPVLLRVAQGLTGSKPDAEDLVQETLIRAFKAIDQFDGAYARAWLLTILRNTNINMNRRQRPILLEDGLVWDSATPAFGTGHEASAEETAIDRSFSLEIQRGLKELDPRFREALILIDVQGLNYAECASVLGVPVGTVMSRLSRARKRLREYLVNTSALEGHSK